MIEVSDYYQQFPSYRVSRRNEHRIRIENGKDGIRQHRQGRRAFRDAVFRPIRSAYFQVELINVCLANVGDARAGRISRFTEDISFYLRQVLTLSRRSKYIRCVAVFDKGRFYCARRSKDAFCPEGFEPFLVHLRYYVSDRLRFFLSNLVVDNRCVIIVVQRRSFTNVTYASFFASSGR